MEERRGKKRREGDMRGNRRLKTDREGVCMKMECNDQTIINRGGTCGQWSAK